jgi:hypothetical protein
LQDEQAGQRIRPTRERHQHFPRAAEDALALGESPYLADG